MPILAAAENGTVLDTLPGCYRGSKRKRGRYDPTYCRRAADLGSPPRTLRDGDVLHETKRLGQSKDALPTAARRRVRVGTHWTRTRSNKLWIRKLQRCDYRVVAESDDEMAIVALAWIGDLRLRDEDFFEAYSWFLHALILIRRSRISVMEDCQLRQRILTLNRWIGPSRPPSQS